MSKFQVGDKVRIVSSSAEYMSDWFGLEAEIIGIDDWLGPHLKPLSDRPDGYGRDPFYWGEEGLEVVTKAAPEAPEHPNFIQIDHTGVAYEVVATAYRDALPGDRGPWILTPMTISSRDEVDAVRRLVDEIERRLAQEGGQ